MLSIDLEQEPLFLNERGVRFWLHPMLTDEAEELGDVVAYVLQEPDGQKWYMVATHGGKPLHTTKLFESAASHIEWLKVIKRRKP